MQRGHGLGGGLVWRRLGQVSRHAGNHVGQRGTLGFGESFARVGGVQPVQVLGHQRLQFECGGLQLLRVAAAEVLLGLLPLRQQLALGGNALDEGVEFFLLRTQGRAIGSDGNVQQFGRKRSSRGHSAAIMVSQPRAPLLRRARP